MNIQKSWTSLLSLIVLSACATEKGSAPPPSFHMEAKETETRYAEQIDVASLQSIEPAAGTSGPEDYRAYNAYQPYTAGAALEGRDTNNCGLGERFDHQALLAYQWGRNRVGLNVDRVNAKSVDHVKNHEAEEVKMTYRIKLQNNKGRAENCRYNSSWQGLIGSGYNEFYLR